jgi:hypothetical protein
VSRLTNQSERTRAGERMETYSSGSSGSS